jgi:hypothetical protein
MIRLFHSIIPIIKCDAQVCTVSITLATPSIHTHVGDTTNIKESLHCDATPERVGLTVNARRKSSRSLYLYRTVLTRTVLSVSFNLNSENEMGQ